MTTPMPNKPVHELETVQHGYFDWWSTMAILTNLIAAGGLAAWVVLA